MSRTNSSDLYLFANFAKIFRLIISPHNAQPQQNDLDKLPEWPEKSL